MSHAHAHEEALYGEIVGDLPENFLHDFANEWQAVEERIKHENNLKASMLAKVRAVHGPTAADALKITMRLLAKDPSKRVREDATGKIARRFLRIIEGDPGHSRFHQ